MTAAEIVRELREAVTKVPRPVRRPLTPPLAYASDADLDRAAGAEFMERARRLLEGWDGK